MPKLVVLGATLECSMGTAPAKLNVLPADMIDATDVPAASIQAHVPNTNVPPFAMCRSPSNPQVAAATAAASGVLTPQPCLPVLAAPWSPGAKHVTVAGQPALTADSQCACNWAGQIRITDPGQTDVDVD
ncbi:MAG: DUF4280 domain-containing protein [Myxococcales bacterium]|nr:DUF4280 domain-containing protein [Myxococcales bacterium]MBL8719827.1 DUF4280 domain-containing protein [Myxococcales bacterium]